jgi:glutamyl-tRNA synthetase
VNRPEGRSAIAAQAKQQAGKVLPPLPNTDKYQKIITRFAPNPDFVLHLGSVRAIILSHDYARMYAGSFIVRYEDTDPRLKKSVLEYYDLIREDLKWLECPWDEEYIQSDRISIYYEYVAKLLAQGSLFVCTCSPEAFRARVTAGQACPCRNKTADENISEWEKMLSGGYQEGEAVVRVKTELAHPNPAVRDWPALRVIDPEKHPHPRIGSKYWVWPLYNFSAAIDDHLMNISHIIRGKEHQTNELRQRYLYRYLGWSYPEAIHYGRLRTVGIKLSKSEMVREVEEGLVDGYSDPRLATLAALRRRGYVPSTLRKLVYELGPRPVDASLSWENINALNRKEIDPISHRYSLILDPVPLEVSHVDGSFEAHLPLHPGQPTLGNRTLKVQAKDGTVRLWLSRNDIELVSKSKVVRLMELFNVEVGTADENSVRARFHSQDYMKARELKSPLIQWLPIDQHLPARVVMPDAKKTAGLVEQAILSEPVRAIVQMVRVGFGRVDSKDPEVLIYFAHR